MKSIIFCDNLLYKCLKVFVGLMFQQCCSGQVLFEGFYFVSVYFDMGVMFELCVMIEGVFGYVEVQVIVVCIDVQWIVMLLDVLFGQLLNVVNGVGFLLLVDWLVYLLFVCVMEMLVVFDGVQDVGNVGLILCSVVVVGVCYVFCVLGMVYVWLLKVLCLGMGVYFLLLIYEDVDVGEFFGCFVVLVVLIDLYGVQVVYDCDLLVFVVWVFGNEGVGVLVFWCDVVMYCVMILQLGGMELLNVVVVVVVCLFEQVWQWWLV